MISINSIIPFVAIAIGAIFGAWARWGFSIWLNAHAQLAYGTLLANWLGAFLIGIIVALLETAPQINPVWRLALITGFLGSLTTFSSFSLEVIQMLMQERYFLALLTSVLHILGSLFLTYLGFLLARFCVNF